MAEQAGGGTPQGPGGMPGQNGQGAAGGGTPSEGSQPPTFDTWLAGQDETVKGLLAQHTQGLKSALDAERTQRGDLAKQVRDLAAKAEEGSELKKSLTEALAKIDQSDRRIAFVEEAITPAVSCRNIKAAWALALAEGLFDKRGNPDWAALKAAAPELFGVPTTPGHAGVGTGAPQQTAPGMNDFIRRAAGRS
jgi:hypothetical protein